MSVKPATPTALNPRHINEDNVPHMLRDLAGRIDRGEMPCPKTVFVVMLIDGDDQPMMDQYGKVGNRMEEVGALTMAAHWHMRDTGEESDE